MRNFGPTSLYCVLAHVFEQIHLILQLLLLWVPSWSLEFVGVSGDCLPAGEFQEPSQTKDNKMQDTILSMRHLSYEYKLLTGRGIWIGLGKMGMPSMSKCQFWDVNSSSNFSRPYKYPSYFVSLAFDSHESTWNISQESHVVFSIFFDETVQMFSLVDSWKDISDWHYSASNVIKNLLSTSSRVFCKTLVWIFFRVLNLSTYLWFYGEKISFWHKTTPPQN